MAAPIIFRGSLNLLRFNDGCALFSKLNTRCLPRLRRDSSIKNGSHIHRTLQIKCLSHLADVTSDARGILSLTINVRQRKSCPSVILIPNRLCSTSAPCWNCTAVPSHDSFNKNPYFCNQCSTIQPVEENITHFQRMNCVMTFDLDTSQLQRSFRLLQSKLHPDKFSTKSETEMSYSADQSSAVNKAYRTLQHPLSRGLYMLELAGCPLEEGDSNVDPAFLMEIMEVNETLSELEDLDEVKKIGKSNSDILQALTKELSREFENKNYEKARETLVRLKYYANIDDKVKEKLGTSTV